MATAIATGRLRLLIERFADALEASNSDRSVIRRLREISLALACWDDRPVADLVRAARQHSSVSTSDSLETVLPSLNALGALLLDITSSDLKKGLDSLLSVLRAHKHTSTTNFADIIKRSVASASQPKNGKRGAAPMDSVLIDEYVTRLQEALGEDRKFKLLVEELGADRRVMQREAIAIAARFYGRLPKNTSRTKALARIRERHDKLMEFKKQASTAGRSAA